MPPEPPTPLLLPSTNRPLTCGWCKQQCYLRTEICGAEDNNLVVQYKIECRNRSNCNHSVRSKHSAMEAEALFEE